MAEPQTVAELSASIERARARLARNADALRHDLDVASHVKESFHRHKAAYIGGASVFGLLLSKLPARKKKVYIEAKGSGKGIKEAEKAGLWLIVLQFLFKTFRPALTSLISKQVTEFVKSRARNGE